MSLVSLDNIVYFTSIQNARRLLGAVANTIWTLSANETSPAEWTRVRFPP